MGTYFIGINALSIERNWGQSEGKYLYKYPAPITASYFLAAFFGLGAGFLEDTAAFLVGIFFALPPAFLATFFGALAVAFSFLAADLAASPMRAFSSADSLKQPDPFLPGCAPGTIAPSSRIFFRVLKTTDHDYKFTLILNTCSNAQPAWQHRCDTCYPDTS